MQTPRTFEERLKFDHGLTIGTHAVTLVKDSQRLAAVVTIPARGAPRVQVIQGAYLKSFRVVGNDLLPLGVSAAYVYAQRFAELTAAPAATITI